MRIEPAPTPEEAAAIMAALEVLRGEDGEKLVSQPDRWELSGRLGWILPLGMRLEGSPWSYADWEGKS